MEKNKLATYTTDNRVVHKSKDQDINKILGKKYYLHIKLTEMIYVSLYVMVL